MERKEYIRKYIKEFDWNFKYRIDENFDCYQIRLIGNNDKSIEFDIEFYNKKDFPNAYDCMMELVNLSESFSDFSFKGYCLVLGLDGTDDDLKSYKKCEECYNWLYELVNLDDEAYNDLCSEFYMC